MRRRDGGRYSATAEIVSLNPRHALEQAARRGAANAYREWIVKHDTASSFGKAYGNAS